MVIYGHGLAREYATKFGSLSRAEGGKQPKHLFTLATASQNVGRHIFVTAKQTEFGFYRGLPPRNTCKE